MDSLFSFPVGLFIPYNMPVYPGALRVTDRPTGIRDGAPACAARTALLRVGRQTCGLGRSGLLRPKATLNARTADGSELSSEWNRILNLRESTKDGSYLFSKRANPVNVIPGPRAVLAF